MRYLSPLRYPGGKAKLADFVKLLLEQNQLLDGVYVEPYAGGASVALSLLHGEYVSKVHINDLDRAVFSFWHSVLNDTEQFCRLVNDRRVSRAEWHRQKAVQGRPWNHTLLELGFSTFFLNRTNRSGIIASGGMIGGAQQTGEWKLDARYNKAELTNRIQTIARYRDRIVLHNEDASDLLRKLFRTLPRKSLVYLDPPYYVKGKRRLYANFYEHDDHAAIASLVENALRPWIVSYDDAREIRALYNGFESRSYQLGYSASGRYEGAEVMFFSPDLLVPRMRPS
jgi:DNA adenine methylase